MDCLSCQERIDEKCFARISKVYAKYPETLAILAAIFHDEEVEKTRQNSSIWALLRSLQETEFSDQQIVTLLEKQIDAALRDNPRILLHILKSANIVIERQKIEKEEHWHERCIKVFKAVNEGTMTVITYIPPDVLGVLINYLYEIKKSVTPESFLTFALNNKLLCVAVITTTIAFIPSVGSIYLWFKGKMTGRECIRNLTEGASVLSVSIAGAVVGYSAGMTLNSYAAVVACIVGFFATAFTTFFFTDKYLDKIFGIPPEQAVMEAYDYMGIPHMSSDKDVHVAIIKKLIETRARIGAEDTPERKQEYLKTQLYATTIKVSRGWHPAALALKDKQA